MQNLESYTNRKVVYHAKQDGGTVTNDITCTLIKVLEQGIVLSAHDGSGEKFQERFIPWDAVGYVDLVPSQGDRIARAL